jgi:hypothetical protein
VVERGFQGGHDLGQVRSQLGQGSGEQGGVCDVPACVTAVASGGTTSERPTRWRSVGLGP